ncbi:MAG: 1,4-dihydroxy-2-naphthoate octaprenyltransferase [Deferribacteraceae bacterium]|jgi:1,4-dihydroxy-2-naphthoate octaprenyltransferase|nr:1,4-dihydroxy-2-naphthoate octaprenyltransferase [Deferribacteraceae bacterium]
MNREKIALWISAARPKTLPGSITPVIVAGALAYKDGFTHLTVFFAAFLVALSAQIASNFANDYFDYKKGADTRIRVGPKRAVATGAAAPKEMLAATVIMLVLTVSFGVYIAYECSLWLLLVGALICITALAYSAGPYPLAYNGWGDLCVIVFYGVIPVIFTYYAITGGVSLQAVMLSVSIGIITDNILLVNNYRDYKEDSLSGKNTSVVVCGRDFGAKLFLSNIICAFLIAFAALRQFSLWFIALYILLFVVVILSWRKLITSEGRELNILLGQTGRNVLIFGLLLTAGILCQSGTP